MKTLKTRTIIALVMLVMLIVASISVYAAGNNTLERSFEYDRREANLDYFTTSKFKVTSSTCEITRLVNQNGNTEQADERGGSYQIRLYRSKIGSDEAVSSWTDCKASWEHSMAFFGLKKNSKYYFRIRPINNITVLEGEYTISY